MILVSQARIDHL